MKPCVTISLVPEAEGGPFVFWDGLDDGCQRAADLGFDAVEVFPPDAESIDAERLESMLEQHDLCLAAVGTGAGWVKHGLSLTAADAAQRQSAIEFVKTIIDFAGPFQAPAIIGSMQGRHGNDVSRTQAQDWLRAALDELGEYAEPFGVPLIYEPLNRYETNLCCKLADGVRLVESLSTGNVRLLADLFHMNIEESDVAQSIADAGAFIGHVHFVDSNRCPAGGGHTNFSPIVAALEEIDYAGFLSAEAFPVPDPQTAAKMTIDAIRRYVR